MALGIEIGGTPYVPDRNIQRTSKPNVYRIQFGDGYEQRLQRGINNLVETYQISFNNRPNSEIDTIIDFFDSNAGVTAFDFTIPDTQGNGGVTTIQVVCEDYSQTYFNLEVNSCSATLRRVYEL